MNDFLSAFPDWPYTNVHQLNLDWVIQRLREVIEFLKAKAQQIEGNSENIKDLQARVKKLENLIQQIQDGGFDELYLAAVEKWLAFNLPQMVRDLVKYVVFGLSLDGYFVAVIPEAWDFIMFDTIANPDSDLYGHLVLQW